MLSAIQNAKEIRARLWNPPTGRQSSELDIVPESRRRRLAAAIVRSRHRQFTAAESRLMRELAFLEIFEASNITLTLPGIKKLVCRYYGLDVEQLRAARRTVDLVRPRQIVMYLAKTHIPGLSLPQIGRLIARMDHTTVLHGVRKITSLMKTDIRLAAEVENFERDLGCYRDE